MESKKEINSKDSVIINRDEDIGYIIFNRPEKLNVFDEEMFLKFERALDLLDKDKNIKVVVLKGRGKAFCTGIDLNILRDKDPISCYFWMNKIQGLTESVRSFSKPIISCVQDLALAFGIGLVAASDIVIAAEDARFGAIAVNVGLFCMGPAVFLAQNIGIKKAVELLFTGKIIDAEEAYKIGLVNKVVAISDLEEETLAFARDIAVKNALALRLGKIFFYKMLKNSSKEESELASLYFSLLWSHKETQRLLDEYMKKIQNRN